MRLSTKHKILLEYIDWPLSPIEGEEFLLRFFNALPDDYRKAAFYNHYYDPEAKQKFSVQYVTYVRYALNVLRNLAQKDPELLAELARIYSTKDTAEE